MHSLLREFTVARHQEIKITSTNVGWQLGDRAASYWVVDPASNDPAAEDPAIDTPTDVTWQQLCPRPIKLSLPPIRYEHDLFSGLAKLSKIEGRV